MTPTTVIITKEAHDALREAAIYEWNDESTQWLNDGCALIRVEDDVLNAIRDKQLVGESLSDCIVRLCSTAQ